MNEWTEAADSHTEEDLGETGSFPWFQILQVSNTGKVTPPLAAHLHI